MENRYIGPPLAEHISLPGNNRIYVLIHKAGRIEWGDLDHVDLQGIPSWTYKVEKVPGLRQAYLLLKAPADPSQYLVTSTMQSYEEEYYKQEQSQCFIVNGNNLYKAMLYPQNMLAAFRFGNKPLVMVQTADSPQILMGFLEHYHGTVPHWVQKQ